MRYGARGLFALKGALYCPRHEWRELSIVDDVIEHHAIRTRPYLCAHVPLVCVLVHLCGKAALLAVDSGLHLPGRRA